MARKDVERYIVRMPGRDIYDSPSAPYYRNLGATPDADRLRRAQARFLRRRRGGYAVQSGIVPDFATFGHHIVVTADCGAGNEVIFYRNGANAVSKAYATALQNISAGKFGIGNDFQAGNNPFHHMDGNVGHVAFYDTILTPTQVANHYTAGITYGSGYADVISADSPVYYWKLDEGSGSTFTDTAGNQDCEPNNSPTLGTAGVVPSIGDTSVDLVQANDESIYSGRNSPNHDFLPLINGGATQTITFECWIRPDLLTNPDSGSYTALYHNGTFATSDAGSSVGFRPDGKLFFINGSGFSLVETAAGYITAF